MQLLRSRAALAATVVLLLQGAGYYAVASRPELVAPMQPLSFFPSSLGSWFMREDMPIEQEVLDVLKADDTLNRRYSDGTAQALLFIAYFKTQRQGAAPHSPKNCLPGSGWEPVQTPSRIQIQIPGQSAPINSNLYVVARGEQRSVVLYWYQSHARTIASEFSAKYWLVADAIRYRRSDTALVKIVVPFGGQDTGAATQAGIRFAREAFPRIQGFLPE